MADRVRWLDQQLRERLVDQLIDTVPSYASVLVIYRPDRIRMEALQEHIEEFGRATSEPMTKEEGRLVTLPVWYGTESGPDLAALAESNGLSLDEVVRRHHLRQYRVYAIGFAPGLPTWARWMRPLPGRDWQRQGNTYRPDRWALRIGRRRCIRPNRPAAGT